MKFTWPHTKELEEKEQTINALSNINRHHAMALNALSIVVLLLIAIVSYQIYRKWKS